LFSLFSSPSKFNRDYSEEEASRYSFIRFKRQKGYLVSREICCMPFKEEDPKKLMPDNTASINSYNISLVTFSLWHQKEKKWFTLKC